MRAGVVSMIAAFGIGFAAGACLCGRVQTRRGQLRVLTRCDTVRVEAPVRTMVRYLKADTVRVAVVDTPDTVRVLVPFEQAEYSGDGYRAYVSGYNPRLDSMVMLRSVSTTIAATPRSPRFSLGLQAGYGLTPRGLQPYVGLGVSYSIKF